MTRIARALASWILAASTAAIGGTEPIILPQDLDTIPLDGHVEVLRDDRAEWTINDVLSIDISRRFQGSSGSTFYYGHTDATYWYHLKLRSTTADVDSQNTAILELEHPLLDYLDIYLVRSSGAITTIRAGELRQAPPQQLSHRRFAFPLQLAPDEVTSLYVRATNAPDPHVFSMRLWTFRGFQEYASLDNLWYGTFYGILLVMIFYNFIIYILVRDRAYASYVLYIMAILLFAALNAGHARQFGNSLHEYAPLWINTSYYVVFALTLLFGGLFLRDFLQTKKFTPWIDRLIVVLIVLAASYILLLPFGLKWLISRLEIVHLGIFGAVGLAAATYLAHRGSRPARILLVAWGALLSTSAIVALAIFGIIPANNLTLNAWQIGVCLDVTLLSLALADRINEERKGRFVAAEAATRLKSFLPQRVADLVIEGGEKGLLEPRRQKVTVLVMDLRGFTAFSETSTPEDIMAVLRDFYESMGGLVEKHGGTVEHFAGDSMLVFFNAPLEIPDHERHAVETALEMHAAFGNLRARWKIEGHELGLGIGIAGDYATIGAIGFSGRSQYAAIGPVSNLASRLCANAKHGEILIPARLLPEVEELVQSELVGDLQIKGFSRPITIVKVLGRKNDHLHGEQTKSVSISTPVAGAQSL